MNTLTGNLARGLGALILVTAIAMTACSKADSVASEKSSNESVSVLLCDGETCVDTGKAAADMLPQDGKIVADELMAQWKHQHPDSKWVDEELSHHTVTRPFDNSALLSDGQGEGQTYGQFSRRDVLVWERETFKFAVEGSRIFHNGTELGSTIAVSCDMCHPHAANTHPETYPKYQTQLGRVALLRDMINWCLEHPVRAKKLDADDPKMRALEAYIYAQRRGKTLDYGKH